jgi:hypothetical protein
LDVVACGELIARPGDITVTRLEIGYSAKIRS